MGFSGVYMSASFWASSPVLGLSSPFSTVATRLVPWTMSLPIISETLVPAGASALRPTLGRAISPAPPPSACLASPPSAGMVQRWA